MPALSSTMTEGKVRSVGADWSCWEEGGGPLSERASERGEIYGPLFFVVVVARASLARFGPVASSAGQGKGKKAIRRPLSLLEREPHSLLPPAQLVEVDV